MKNLIRLSLVLVIFFAGFWFGQLQVQAPAKDFGNSELAKEIKSDLSVDYGSNRTQEFRDVSLVLGASVYDLLKEVEKSSNLKLQVKDYGGEMGVLIEGLGDVVNDPKTGTYWQLWVNGQYAKVGASAYKLNSGDKVEWKYINSQIK